MNEEKKILIVEDERPIARAMELKLTHEGFNVTVVANGQLGLDKLMNDKFDLVLCDLIMPEMNGFKFLEEVKKNNIESSIIILTNLSQDEDKEKVMELGAKGFFVKSDISISDIVKVVKENL